jgi:hypothetical protein
MPYLKAREFGDEFRSTHMKSLQDIYIIPKRASLLIKQYPIVYLLSQN